jgi:hypothetical protein
VLDVQLADTVKARVLGADGRSVRVRAEGQPGVRSQERLDELIGRRGTAERGRRAVVTES